MSEPRPYVYGRFLAHWVKLTINSLPPAERLGYRIRFVDELQKFSFKPKKQNEPKHEGCVRELEGISYWDLARNPEQLAKGIKEDMHLTYNKGRDRLMMKGLLENL